MEFAPIRGNHMRVTVTDECGLPSTGVGDHTVSEGYIQVDVSPETRARDEIEELNAGGKILVSDTTRPQLKWFNVEIQFLQVNPELFVTMTGQDLIEDYNTDPIGVSIGSEQADTGFALEVWTEIASNEVCAAGAKPYGYFLMPWLDEGFVDGFTIENGAITFTLTARTRAQHQWGVGPYAVMAQDGANTPGPLLSAMPAGKQLDFFQTTIAPPALTA